MALTKADTEIKEETDAVKSKDGLRENYEDINNIEKLTFPQLFRILSIWQTIAIVGLLTTILVSSFMFGRFVNSVKTDYQIANLTSENRKLKEDRL